MNHNRQEASGEAYEFDQWIRHRFVELNSTLERLYAKNNVRELVSGIGEDIKQSLVEEGRKLVIPLLREGNTDQGFESGFNLLGNVGLYMAACRRHEITLPDRESRSPLREASALAMHLGASLGVTPRFATSHLTTHNGANNGVYKKFTDLDAEALFIEYNTRGIFGYKRAADALERILPLGVSHPIAYDLLHDAERALQAVQRANDSLYANLDVDQFFYSVRPYYKPFRVGLHVYRGANAGDFAGINEIDMLLGLCQANDAAYSQQLVDKFLYMMPEDQTKLRDCMRQTTLLDDFVAAMDNDTSQPWIAKNGKAFLAVCDAHGDAAKQHHDQLVTKFIEHPSQQLPDENLEHITASGPPLPVLLAGLEKLRDLRCAADREDIPSRYKDIQRLRSIVGAA
ncbi:MAG: monodechloroaminopyrrolnitrin synthase PrnB family protein [Woeseiaceae bacterium]